ncbi:transcriptional regulator [Mycobacterium sp. 852013-50091_SCH5140682]|uniref:TetR/AcrR family transcriptional regulator n=1 Tax=Mycobacterium sp. 852013-50091_SCH5140682 TaxID=1834109 RepID=UPI0007E988D4|nr:TetR family transcriptional regulator [Mycobacterium sp. 852013-50091_SCH5140682]OBC05045.1 transcriptional regulator [Mycobacterium sp. 852013-50091_SCH5140682]
MGVTYGTGRQALLEAAIRVVASEGLRGLTYRSVAAEAGVSHGSVRYHFGDWNTMVEEALTFSVERSILGSALSSASTDFADFAATLADLVEADPDIQAFQYELALESRRRPELVPMIERMYELYRSAVRDALSRNGIDDESFAQTVFAAMDGVVFQQTIFGDANRTRRNIDALRAVIKQYGVAGRRSRKVRAS